MATNDQEGFDRPYPLAEYLLAILDAVDPYETLKQELKRYTIWTLEGEARLGKIYGAEYALPTQRTDMGWDEQDATFMRIFVRREVLSSIFEEMELEEVVIKDYLGQTEIETCAEVIIRMMEQWESLPCPEKEKAPVDIISIKLLPPMQYLALEIRNLPRKALNEQNEVIRQLYSLRHTLFEVLFEKWLAELLIESSTQGFKELTYLHFANWTIIVHET